MAPLWRSFRGIICVVSALALIGAWSTSANPPQNNAEKPKARQQDFPKRCSPVVVKNLKVRQKSIQIRKGEKPSGFTPLITFQIAESGEVINARVKRSSGIRDMDEYALNWIKSTKYNTRPGCPVIESESSVNINWAADPT